MRKVILVFSCVRLEGTPAFAGENYGCLAQALGLVVGSCVRLDVSFVEGWPL